MNCSRRRLITIWLAFALTEHYEKDVSYIAGEEAIFNLARYARTVRDLQARGEQLGVRVLYGIELGYLPHLDKLYGRLALRYPFDTIIMSLHILDGEDPYSDQAIVSGTISIR